MKNFQTENDPAPVFLCGHRKCGTTLLHNLFDGHPQACVYPGDLTVLYAYFPLYDERITSRDECARRVEQVVFRHWHSIPEMRENVNIDRYRSAFLSAMKYAPYSTKNVLKALMQTALSEYPVKQPSHLIVKETSIEIHALMLREWFPTAKFIHLLRDPRDNYAALVAGVQDYYSALGDDEYTILHALLERYGLGLRMASDNQTMFGGDVYHLVRFEDLVSDPEKTMRTVCRFLDMPFDKLLTVPTLFGKPTRGNNFDGIELQNVSDAHVGKWRNRCAASAVMTIEYHLGDLMEQHGYAPAFNREEQMRAAAEFYRWSNYRYHYTDRFSGTPVQPRTRD